MFPAPVAATTIPSAPRRDRGIQQRPVHRDRRGDQVDPLGGAGRLDAAPARASPEERDLARPDPPERPAVRAGERVERRRVHLDHVIGRLDRPGQARRRPRHRASTGRPQPGRRRAGWPDHRSRPRPRRASRRSPRPASRRRGRDPSRTRSPRWCRCPGRRRRRRSTGPPAPRGRLPRSRAASGNVKWLAGVRPRSIGDHLGDLVEARRPGEDRRAVERRHIAAGHRVERAADRPAGEHDRDARHRAVRRGRSGRRGPPGRDRASAVRPPAASARQRRRSVEPR